jgi:CopG family transcriptional regulator/antitoxin EndoAI
MERIIVTLPRELLNEIDAAAVRLERKRSRLIRDALVEWLELRRKEEFEALLAEGYLEMAKQSTELVRDFAAAAAEATKNTWRWDD